MTIVAFLLLACGGASELNQPNPPPEWPLHNVQVNHTNPEPAAPDTDDAPGDAVEDEAPSTDDKGDAAEAPSPPSPTPAPPSEPAEPPPATP